MKPPRLTSIPTHTQANRVSPFGSSSSSSSMFFFTSSGKCPLPLLGLSGCSRTTSSHHTHPTPHTAPRLVAYFVRHAEGYVLYMGVSYGGEAGQGMDG